MSVSRAQTILAEADLRPHLTEQWVMSELGPEFDAQAAEVCGLYVDPHPASLSGRRREWTPDPERYERNLISTCSAASDQCDGTSTSSSRAASRLARSDIAEPARDEGGGKPGHESDGRRGSGVKSEEVEQECFGCLPRRPELPASVGVCGAGTLPVRRLKKPGAVWRARATARARAPRARAWGAVRRCRALRRPRA